MAIAQDITSEEFDALQERIRLAPPLFIAARIRRARRDAGLSHDAFGALCGGVSRQHLIKLEQAKHKPRAPMLLSIARGSERPIDWFVDPDVDPSPFPDEAAAA
jgi:transcriptional regulator with XRE-family HTH domain